MASTKDIVVLSGAAALTLGSLVLGRPRTPPTKPSRDPGQGTDPARDPGTGAGTDPVQDPGTNTGPATGQNVRVGDQFELSARELPFPLDASMQTWGIFPQDVVVLQVTGTADPGVVEAAVVGARRPDANGVMQSIVYGSLAENGSRRGRSLGIPRTLIRSPMRPVPRPVEVGDEVEVEARNLVAPGPTGYPSDTPLDLRPFDFKPSDHLILRTAGVDGYAMGGHLSIWPPGRDRAEVFRQQTFWVRRPAVLQVTRPRDLVQALQDYEDLLYRLPNETGVPEKYALIVSALWQRLRRYGLNERADALTRAHDAYVARNRPGGQAQPPPPPPPNPGGGILDDPFGGFGFPNPPQFAGRGLTTPRYAYRRRGSW